MDIHQRFGGVVPEVASRRHVESITLVVEEALKEACITMPDLSAVAVTKGPGLVGALLVGLEAAKALAWAHQLPLIGIHHLAGHIYANQLVESFLFPNLALIVSGGHTELVLMKEHGSFQVLGQTRDDAAGEAYDKVARALGLPYPGGPEIDRLAKAGRTCIAFPRAWLEPDSYDFSFSGLKSAVLNYINQTVQKGESLNQADVAASFQDSVIDVLVTKTMQAAEAYGVRQVMLAGGVAANSELRARLSEACRTKNIPVVIPPVWLCTDNAAMIACAGYFQYLNGEWASLELNASASLPLA
jgi:N6-L-threonylcarbamoyladenine synthase